MFKPLQILDETNPILRKKSLPVEFPLSNKDKKTIKQIIRHLKYSQIDLKCEQYSLRPGMGLAFPQLGILKRIIVIVYEKEENEFDIYVVVNPKVTSHSQEKIAAFEGEGCLSVTRDVEGHVLRHARVTVKGFDENEKKISLRLHDDLAIAFQHEIDHLEGILFWDKINPKKPYYLETEIRLI